MNRTLITIFLLFLAGCGTSDKEALRLAEKACEGKEKTVTMTLGVYSRSIAIRCTIPAEEKL